MNETDNLSIIACLVFNRSKSILVPWINNLNNCLQIRRKWSYEFQKISKISLVNREINFVHKFIQF